jgi:hypothetical protein
LFCYIKMPILEESRDGEGSRMIYRNDLSPTEYNDRIQELVELFQARSIGYLSRQTFQQIKMNNENASKIQRFFKKRKNRTNDRWLSLILQLHSLKKHAPLR